MALDDIVFRGDNSSVASRGDVGSVIDTTLLDTSVVNRGNIGILTDIDSSKAMVVVFPPAVAVAGEVSFLFQT